MKCPKCKANHPYSRGMVCSNCNRRFVFDPKTSKMTDGYFTFLLSKVSEKGTYHFTLNQLFALSFRKYRAGKYTITRLFLSLVAIIFVTIITIFRDDVTFALFMVIIPIIFIWSLFKGKPAFTTSFLDNALKSWSKKEKSPSKLILKSGKLAEVGNIDKEFFAYGVEGIIICDQDLYVDLIVLNGWHKESKCAVISKNGYPATIYGQCKHLLITGNTPVYLLHDGETPPQSMHNRLLPEYSQSEIIDLGFSNEDFLTYRSLRKFKRSSYTKQSFDLLLPKQIHNLLPQAIREKRSMASIMEERKSGGYRDSDFFTDFG